jgi:uncharacterized membrane protein YkvA (DUF1232 family)
MNNKIDTQEEILEEIEIRSESISRDQINEIISEEKRINKKSSALDIKKFGRFIKQVKLAMSLMKDFRAKSYTDIPWRSIGFLAAAVLYFLNPFDVVPDMLPVFGFGDDAMLFAAVFKSIQTDLEKYAEWKGVNTKEYF